MEIGSGIWHFPDFECPFFGVTLDFHLKESSRFMFLFVVVVSVEIPLVHLHLLFQDKNNNDLRDLEAGEDDWSCYRLNLTDEIVIDIPREMSSTQSYCASLGHKVRPEKYSM